MICVLIKVYFGACGEKLFVTGSFYFGKEMAAVEMIPVQGYM